MRDPYLATLVKGFLSKSGLRYMAGVSPDLASMVDELELIGKYSESLYKYYQS